MTENEAIKLGKDLCENITINANNIIPTKKYIEFVRIAIQSLEEIQQYRAIGTMEEVRMLKDYKELYDAYNLIGTIEEFRTLKMNQTVLPIATITIDKEDMQKIVDEKVAQIELDIQEIRAKAIDEFSNRLHSKIIAEIDDCADELDWIEEIAEQMKG